MWGSDLGRGKPSGEPLNADILKAKSGAGELAVCSVLGMLRGEDIGTKR